MNSHNKTWQSMQADYLQQVQNALSAFPLDQANEILEDVRFHLQNRYEELPDDQKTWENFQAIITDMGPPSDYAELSESTASPEKPPITRRYLAAWILGFILLTAASIALPLLIRSYSPSRENQYPISSKPDLPYDFENDPQILGSWKSVDFVEHIDQFHPGSKYWQGDLFLKNLTFYPYGLSASSFTWTKGWIWSSDRIHRAEYQIKILDGKTYLFFPWLSGDVTLRNQKPHYYVLIKTTESQNNSESPQNADPK